MADAATDILNNSILPQETQTKSRVTFGLDGNPDEAARTLQLSQTTGVPTSVIAPDVDRFDKANQANMARDIVMNNGKLRDYVNSNAMAAQVSNDDWGNLDKVSESAGMFARFKNMLGGSVGEAAAAEGEQSATLGNVIGEGFRGAIAGAREGFGPDSLLDSDAVAKAFPALDPAKGPLAMLSNLAATAGLGAGELAGRTMSAVGGGITGAIQGGVTPLVGEKSAEDFGHMADIAQILAGAHVPEVSDAAKLGEGPWAAAGKEPPAGVNRALDASKASINEAAVDKLQDILTEAQASTTKDRAPEMFRSFMEQHFHDGTIGLDGTAVAKLYGDTVPSPDDGKLGFVPGIADKVAAARDTGADVEVPIAHWLAHVDPALAKDLHDDIRVWPGGITANEAKVLPEPHELIDAPLPQVRGAASLEPQFAIGDRKLTLAPPDIESADPELFKGGEFHTLQILDDRGVHMGDLTLTPDAATKTLHVEMINGTAGQWANSFGPSLIMDLKSQLARMYPGYEKLEGQRVTGAAPGRTVSVKLDDGTTVPKGWGVIEGTRRVFAEGYRPVEHGVDVNIQPSSAYLTHEKAVAGAIHDEIAKITSGKGKIAPTAGVRYGDRNVQGVYFPRSGMMMYDLLGDDPVGTARHESIHFLRDQGLFTDKEWSTLEDAAKDEGWLDRYHIHSRYEQLSPEKKLEEAIAEGFREWARTKEEARRQYSPVAQVFSKLWDFLQNVKGRFAEIFGHVPTKDELFSKITSGEIGDRASEGPGASAAPMFSEEDHLDNLKASGLGLDTKSFKRLQSLYEERHKSDVEASERSAEKEQARRQTKEWRDNKAEMAKEVEETIRQRPDVAADLFIGSGELYGTKYQQRFTLKADDLTPEQKASLPDHYVSKHGLPTDEVAKLFGYTSGDALVGHLGLYNTQKEGRSPQAMLRHVVDTETDIRMEAKYGNLGANILTSAKDQALAENTINILTEEYRAMAEQAGVTAIDKETLKAGVQDQISKVPIGELNSDKLIANMAKHGRDVERSMLAGDMQSVVESMQRKVRSAMMAAEARKTEKAMTAFDKLAKSMSKRVVESMDPEYTNYVHQILQSIGKPVRRSIQDLEEAIEAGHSKNLADFVDIKSSMLRELPVWDQLFDKNWKKQYAQLTTEEFQNVNDSIRSLVHNGRDELKIYKSGEAADFAQVRASLIGKLARFKELPYDIHGKPIGSLSRGLKPVKTFTAAHMQIETILNHWDKEDSQGPWNQYVFRDLVDGVNQEAAYRKEYANRLRAAADKVDLNKAIDNALIRIPLGDGKFGAPAKLTRANLRAIMLNMGNASNEAKFAAGYGLKVDQLRAFVHQHALKEDWEFAQKIWDIHDDIWDKVKTMYRSLSGVAPKSVEIRPVETPFGQYKGGYYPVIYHPEFEGKSRRLAGKDPLEGQNYVRATPPSGYTKERTGYSAPMAVDLDMLPNRIGQQLHDLSLRPAVINVDKVFRDPAIRAEIMRHYGTETRDLLVPYLKDVANSANYSSRAQSEFGRWSEFFRQNMVATLVGVNPGTVMKHAPTAFVQSLNEVGAVPFLKATKSLFSINDATGETNWKTAMTKSLELQRRHQNYMENITGAMQELQPSNKLDSLRHTIIQLGTTPVAFSDLLSAVPTWLAAYEKGLREHGNEGDAVFAADRSVRRAHGSSAITSRPAIMRDWNPWVTSVYTFFNHIMNRQAELAWKAGDMLGDTGRADYGKAMAKIPAISAQLFAYVLFPALIEEIASPQDTVTKEPWEKRAAKSVAYTMASSWVVVRDMASALLNNRDPSVGIFTTAFNDVRNVYRDLGKNEPLNKEHAGRIVQDASALAGLLTGIPGDTIGRAGRFAQGVATGQEHPHGPWGWLAGARYGTLKGHSSTLSNYLQGKAQ